MGDVGAWLRWHRPRTSCRRELRVQTGGEADREEGQQRGTWWNLSELATGQFQVPGASRVEYLSFARRADAASVPLLRCQVHPGP